MGTGAIREAPPIRRRQNGIEWIAYGPDLKPPEKLPTFEAMIKTYRENSTASKYQREKVIRAFEISSKRPDSIASRHHA